MELVSKLSDTPTYVGFVCDKALVIAVAPMDTIRGTPYITIKIREQKKI